MNKLARQAFTLIELLVVIAIIGILSGLIVVSMSGVTAKANIAKGQVFANSLRNSMLSDLVVELKLDSNAIDTWGSIPVGTITGAATSTDCVYGTCYSFNGTNSDNISFGDQPSLSFANNIFTFTFWMKRASSSSTIAVLGKTNGVSSPYEYGIYGSTGSQLCLTAWTSAGSGVYSSTCSSIDDGWAFFAWTSDGTAVRPYKNGVAGTSINKTAGNSMSDTTAPFILGKGCNGGACYFHNGLIDDVKIYDVALPTSQIREQYYAGLNRLLASGKISINEYNQRIIEVSKK